MKTARRNTLIARSAIVVCVLLGGIALIVFTQDTFYSRVMTPLTHDTQMVLKDSGRPPRPSVIEDDYPDNDTATPRLPTPTAAQKVNLSPDTPKSQAEQDQKPAHDVTWVSTGTKNHKKSKTNKSTEALRASPPGDDELLANAITKLKNGNLAYNSPERMTTHKTERVIARIGGPSVAPPSLEAGFPSDPNHRSQIEAAPVSPFMKMTLKSADFDITPLSSEEQIVAGDKPTAWEWDIIAKHSGKLNLHLAAVVVLNQLQRDFTAVDRSISVEVDPMDAVSEFVKTNWQWIIATLTAVGGAAWKFFNDRKSKSGQSPPAESKAATK